MDCPECGAEIYEKIGEENEPYFRCSDIECGYTTDDPRNVIHY